ncbi:MAG: triose-phosphate isomerase [Ruminococcaceae bacterium]|nr:triose-phosphate isomerase [Oscillospiraceae bacterium]
MKIKAPFFEIGPKTYLYGQDVVALAKAADEASRRYDVDIIFTAAYVDIYPVAKATKNIHVFAPHMDPIQPGRGVADILPEAIKAAGAEGVMLNHVEKPLTLSAMKKAIDRASEIGLATIVCADSIVEAQAIAQLSPDIIVAEPSDLIGTGKVSDMAYVLESIRRIKAVNPDILILQAAGISKGEDVYRVIRAGAEATGSSSGITKAADPADMVDEMVAAVRRAWDERAQENK